VASFVCFYKLNIRATRFYTIKIVSYQSELIHDIDTILVDEMSAGIISGKVDGFEF